MFVYGVLITILLLSACLIVGAALGAGALILRESARHSEKARNGFAAVLALAIATVSLPGLVFLALCVTDPPRSRGTLVIPIIGSVLVGIGMALIVKHRLGVSGELPE